MKKLSLIVFLALLVWACTKDEFATPARDNDQPTLVQERDGMDPVGIDIVIDDFPADFVCDMQLRTHTQQEWSGKPDVLPEESMVLYLQKRFPKVFGPYGRFPGWLTIGFNDNTLTFRSADEVIDYLPQVGPPRVLDASAKFMPPQRGNSLAGETVALMLNVYFDMTYNDFGPGDIKLKNMIIRSEGSHFDGWTVLELLNTANQTLGGMKTGYPMWDLTYTLAAVNENYPLGRFNKGYLDCPDVMEMRLDRVEKVEGNP